MIKSIAAAHPNIDAKYAAGIAVPSYHPPVTFPVGGLPDTHPDIDALLRDPANNPLPAWHPRLGSFYLYDAFETKSNITFIPSWHPSIRR